MSLLVQLETATATVGKRVQDNWGNQGVIAWVGKLNNNPPPPLNGPKNVTYAGVVFDQAKPNSPNRTNGTLGGVTLVAGQEAGRVAFLQPKKDLWNEVIPDTCRQMRERFSPRLDSWHDVEITKFLIARKFDLALTSEMLEAHLTWEEEHGVKTFEYFPPRMAVGYPCGVQKDMFDFDGNLVRVERPGGGGAVAPRDFVTEHGLPLIMRWHICSMEQMKERLRESGWKTQRITMIIDLTEFGSVNSDVAKFGQMEGKIDQDHYPEILARAFIINAPFFFTALWGLIKLFVDDRTKDKIKILGSDYRDEILKYMSEDCLPSCAGGSNDTWFTTAGGGKVGALSAAASKAAAAQQAAAAASAAGGGASAGDSGAADASAGAAAGAATPGAGATSPPATPASPGGTARATAAEAQELERVAQQVDATVAARAGQEAPDSPPNNSTRDSSANASPTGGGDANAAPAAGGANA